MRDRRGVSPSLAAALGACTALLARALLPRLLLIRLRRHVQALNAGDYEDTRRIEAFEARLRKLGIRPAD